MQRRNPPPAKSGMLDKAFAVLSSLTSAFQAAVDEARADARAQGYREGYDAAVRKIMAAATEAETPPEAVVPQSSEDGRSRPVRNALPTTARAPWGLVPKAIDRALNGAGFHGIDIPMVITCADALGHLVAESSVRSILIGMTKRGELERRSNGRWYRVGNGGSADEAPPAAAVPSNNQGGSDETALAAE